MRLVAIALLAQGALATTLHSKYFARQSQYTCSTSGVANSAPSCQGVADGSSCQPLCQSGFAPSSTPGSLAPVGSLLCSSGVFSPATYYCVATSVSALTDAQKAALERFLESQPPGVFCPFILGIFGGCGFQRRCRVPCGTNGRVPSCQGLSKCFCSTCNRCGSRQAGNGQFAVGSLGDTAAEQLDGFQQAVCAGLLTTEDNCTINGTITAPCPKCTNGSSKKGLLGLLGLLGLIPLLLLLSSSSLLCLLLLRRKKESDVFYPVGTEVAAPHVVLGVPTVCYGPYGPPPTVFEPPTATPLAFGAPAFGTAFGPDAFATHHSLAPSIPILP